MLESINKVLKTLPERKYTKTYSAWLVQLTIDNYKTIFYTLRSIAVLDASKMKKWFEEEAIDKKEGIMQKATAHFPLPASKRIQPTNHDPCRLQKAYCQTSQYRLKTSTYRLQ